MKITLVIPAHNEELVITNTVRRSFEILEPRLAPHDWQLVVAENASTDRTADLVTSLCAHYPRLRLHRLSTPGKGLAIRRAWEAHPADVYAFMDADLAADLEDVPRVITVALNGSVAIASRHHPNSRVSRSLVRRLTSVGYNLLAQRLLPVRVSDLQCGLKAIPHYAAAQVLPTLQQDGFVFDTELLLACHKAGHAITELPIHWTEAPNVRRRSKIGLYHTSRRMFLDLLSLRNRYTA